MFLVYENEELKVSKNIAWNLKNRYKNIIEPKNIYIYSSNISRNDTACVIREIVKNKTIFYPKDILDEFFNFYFSKNRKGVIFVVSQREIERIIDIIDYDDYKIIVNKKIISIR